MHPVQLIDSASSAATKGGGCTQFAPGLQIVNQLTGFEAKPNELSIELQWRQCEDNSRGQGRRYRQQALVAVAGLVGGDSSPLQPRQTTVGARRGAGRRSRVTTLG